jgi:PAS domain S-box-containing protein
MEKAMRILVVDDNPENIDLMMIMLNSKNYDVISAGNGQEALEKLRSGKFDLIISDILMPIMDGFQLCRECKTDPELGKISFIFYTATYIDEKDEEFALALGAQKFMRKPQEPEVFLKLIKEVLEKSKIGKGPTIEFKGQDENEILKLYSERLITKLEKKNLDLEHEMGAHKATVNKLKESEEKFRSFIEQSSEGTLLANDRGIITECNHALESITGLITGQIIGMSLLELQLKLMPPKSNFHTEIGSFKDAISEFIRTGKSSYFKKPLRLDVVTPKGVYKTILQSVFPIKINESFHIGVLLFDVTELTKTEAAFIREQNLFDSLIETIPDSIYFKDRESRFIRINKQMAVRFGLDNPRKAIGKTDFDFFDEKHARPAFKDEQRIITERKPLIELEEEEVWPDGHTTWVSTTKMPLKNATGDVIGIMGISRDITESKKAKIKLFSLAMRQEAILSAVPDIIMEVNNNKVYTWANKAGIDFFGDDVIGREASYYFEGEQETYKSVQSVFNGDENIIYIESWQRNKNGEKRLLAWRCRTLKDEKGKVTGALSSAHDITARLHAEEVMRKSEEKYRSIFENVQDVYYESLADGTIVEISPSIEIISRGQYRREDLIGKSMYDFYPGPEDRDHLIAEIQKTGSVTDFEIQLRNKDGSFIWCTISAKIRFNAERQIEKIIGSMHDISTRKQADEALRESEKNYRELINGMNETVWIIGFNGNIIDVNNTAVEVLGYSKEEILRIGLNSIDSTLKKEDIKALVKTMPADKLQIFETSHTTKDGRKFPVEVYSSLVTYQGGKAILSIARDITERKHAEEALRVTLAKYKTLFDSFPLGITITDEAGSIVETNPTAEKLLSIPKDEQITRDIESNRWHIIRPDGTLMPSEEYASVLALKQKRKVENVEMGVVKPDNTITWINVTAAPLPLEGHGVVITYSDITERKLVEAALNESERMLSSIFNTVGDVLFLLSVETDGNYRFISVNKAFCNITGLNEEKILGKLVNEVIPEPSISLVLGKYRRAIEENSIIRWEEITEYPKGRLVADVSIAPVFGDKGHCTHLVGSVHDITERKKAEEALKESNIFLQTILNTIPLPIFYKDIEGRYIGFNKSFEEFFGKTSPELTGKTVFEIAPPEYAEIYHTRDLELMKHQGVQIYDTQIIDGHGAKHEVVYHKATFSDSEGHVLGLIGAILDITERKLAEDTILQERSLLRTLIDNLPTGIFVKDKEYRKIIINPIHMQEVSGHLKYLRLNADIDMLGKTDYEVFPEKLAKKFFTEDQKVVRDGSVIINMEGIGYSESGEQKWLMVSKIPLRDKEGEINGMVGVTTDITERRHAEEALKSSEEKFRTIFDSAGEGMFLLDPETRKFMMCNAACSKMLGYTDEEFLSLDITAIYPPEELSLIYEKIENVNADDGIARGDVKFKRKDGTDFSADLSSSPVIIAGKKLIIIVFRDITERLLIENELRSAKEKAEESDKLKTAFLQNISHEVRTPLNGIIGFSDILTSSNLTPEKREQFSKLIRSSGDHLISIVNDIIVMATIDAGQEKLKMDETDINEILQLIKSQNIQKATVKKLLFDINSDLTENESKVLADKTKLLQILTNLVSNAIKFTIEGGIKVNCKIEGVFLKFSVEDTGIGIPSELHKKIFDRFYQIDFSETRLFGGTGLGLSIVQSYAQLLNGEIYVDSEPGRGSIFYFTMPYEPLAIEIRTEKESTGFKNSDLSGKVILIAEDSDINFEYLEAILYDTKATIIRAVNGKEAIETCKENPKIDLVLMDIKMPVLNGYEATKQIMKFRKDLPVIAQTAYAFPDDKVKSLECGCVDHISKPISSDQLISVLNNYLKFE